MKLNRFFTSIVFLVLALTLQLKIKEAAGSGFNLGLATLIPLSQFAPLGEFLAFVFASLLVLNWQPMLSRELVAFFGLLLVAFSGKKLLPWHGALNALVGVAGGVFLFYLFVDPRFLVDHTSVVVQDMLVSTLWGGIVFWVMRREGRKFP